MNKLLLILFLLFNSCVYSQILRTEKDYVQLLDSADNLLSAGKINECMNIFRLIRAESELVNNDSITSEAVNALASIHSVMGNQDSSIFFVNEILKMENPSSYVMIDTYTHLGGNLRVELDYDSSLYYFKLAVELNLQKNNYDSALLASSLMEVSSSYTNLNQGDSALSYCLKAINYVESNKNNNVLAYAYTRISDAFKSVYNIKRAEEYALKAIDVASNTSFKEVKIVAELCLADVYYVQEDYRSALQHLEKALKINDGGTNRVSTKIHIPYLRCRLSLDGYLNDKDIEQLNRLKLKAQEEYDINRIRLIQLNVEGSELSISEFELKWIELWDKLKADHKLYYAKELLILKYRFLKDKGAWEKALMSRDQLSEIDKRYLMDQQHYSINELEARYLKSEQDNAIKLLDQQNEIQSIKINNKNKLLMAGGLGLGLITLLALFLFSSRKTIAFQNRKITRSLDEKDTLLREIHHRVKNNLQVISSLLRLQSNTTDDKVAVEALKEGQSRVQSMSLIHQDLYQKENLTGIIMSDYLGKLCHNLIATYDINKNVIDLELDIEELNLDVDSVVPLGLIINELITNSLKYAFPNNREGLIKISLKEINEKLQLIVSDNGVGIGSMEEMGTTNTFGHRLINSFSRKLNAQVTINDDNGTSVEMLISEYEKIS